MSEKKEYDLQDRLINFAVRIIKLSEALPCSSAGQHICGQLLRSGTSPAPNYGEAQSAESRPDFIHKVKIALKELRETNVWLKIIVKTEMIKPTEKLLPLLQETDELISILFTCVTTAKRNNNPQNILVPK
ncbi:MAG: four helix bundle protein [bacterium]